MKLMTYPISSKLMKILFQPPHALDEEDEDRDIAETIDIQVELKADDVENERENDSLTIAATPAFTPSFPLT